jgi:hypothetical protein
MPQIKFYRTNSTADIVLKYKAIVVASHDGISTSLFILISMLRVLAWRETVHVYILRSYDVSVHLYHQMIFMLDKEPVVTVMSHTLQRY